MNYERNRKISSFSEKPALFSLSVKDVFLTVYIFVTLRSIVRNFSWCLHGSSIDKNDPDRLRFGLGAE